MRLFSAIRIPEEIGKELARLREKIGREPSLPHKVKWVQTQNLHLTLKFFGEIEERRLNDLEESLKEAVKSHQEFRYTLKGLGAFPNAKKARVLWVGLENPLNELASLAASIEKNTSPKGFPPSEKPFSPHLTLARFASPPQPPFLEVTAKHSQTVFGEAAVDKIELIQGCLSSEGPAYMTIQEFPFRAD